MDGIFIKQNMSFTPSRSKEQINNEEIKNEEEHLQQESYSRRLELWNTRRKEWAANKRITAALTSKVPTDHDFDYDEMIEKIINEDTFSNPVPLPLLVDTLVDLWENDGVFE